ncbi:MAG TPA: PLP-dependent aminotransferase family protein [Thermoanaerobaculia bacterium]|jgi:GntR family transcriptional regulator/MocR family aminotransferase|nr:PLP-dependent aminotransferase family protein [Thermoanaerobaculia bacterium]
MAKRTATFALILPPRDAATPAYRWLCTALRAEILEGRLRPGARLPATRDLAAQVGLSRGTIVSAFEQLQAEGYLEGSVGSGTYVNKVLPDELLHVRHRLGGPPPVLPEKPRRLSGFARRVSALPAHGAPPARAFRTDQPALDLFPTTLWAQIAARRLRRASTSLLLGCGPLGYRPLQDAVAEYLTVSRGVACVPEQVAIVSGAQEALDLAARLLLDPGDRVCMEDPGYVGAARVFAACGARIVSAPVDGEGMQLPGRRLRGVRLVYVTPAHQYPLGTSMSLPRRLQLLEWARSSGAAIFEDDYDSEYRYSGRPTPALQGLDRHGVVLFAGSFSKVLFPSLRLGYLVTPVDLVDRVAAAISITNRHAPLQQQAVLRDFIAEGHFGRHVRRMREVYAERLSVLLQCARQRLAGLLEISGVEAGLQTAGWLCGGIDAAAAASAAAERGVEVAPLHRYSRAPLAREGLQLGFAAVDAREIRRGVQELGLALEGIRKGSPGGAHGANRGAHGVPVLRSARPPA